MTDLQSAWLAGLFDGEGSISVLWPKRKNVVVEIKMTSEFTIQKVHELYPGNLSKGHLSGLGAKPQWRWRLNTNGSRDFLQRLLPHLVTKKREAEIAIALCDRSNGSVGFDALVNELKMLRGSKPCPVV